MSALAEGAFGSLSSCALDCFSAAAGHSACVASNITCLCMDIVFSTQATGCVTQSCGVKEGLTATNLTMTTCQVPQLSRGRIPPIVAGILGMLALLMVTVRLGQRSFFKKSLGWDDWLIVAAMACAIPMNCMMFAMQKLGFGTNIWTIPFDNITKQMRLLYIAEVFYMPAEALTQLSFLAFYLVIFPSETFRRIAYGLIGWSICFGISNTFVMIFQCTPITFFWTGWSGEFEGTCIDINSYSWYKAAMQIVVDLIIIALPIRPLMQSSIGFRKKVQIILMFCTGFLITVISCLRLQSLIKFSKSPNATYDNAPAIYWSLVECDTAIICACMPFAASLLKHMLPSVFGNPTGRYYGSTAPNRHWPGSIPLNGIKKDTSWLVSHSETNLVGPPAPSAIMNPVSH